MPDLPALRAGLDATDPEDRRPRLEFADLLDSEEQTDPRGNVLRSACAIHEQLAGMLQNHPDGEWAPPNVILPDRSPSFWTASPGWEAVGRQLDALAAHPEDTDAFRSQYERLIRGGVPLDPEYLEQTLRLQYDLQVRLLSSLNLLEGQPGEQFITAVDGNRYPLPAFEVVLAKLQAPDLQRKLTQGFDTLLVVPFGLPLNQLLDAWREGLRRNGNALLRVGALREYEPLYVFDNCLAEPLVYDPRFFSADHRGRTKEELLASERRGFDVLLVEGTIPNLPRAGRGETLGGRPQIECNRSPGQYLRDLPQGEVGLTPEAYVLASLHALEHQGQVLDTQTATYLLGAFLPTSRRVPRAYWGRDTGQAYLNAFDPAGRISSDGARAAVRVA